MKNLIIREAAVSDAEKIYNIFMQTSDETEFLACSSKERKEDVFFHLNEASPNLNSKLEAIICRLSTYIKNLDLKLKKKFLNIFTSTINIILHF